MIPSTQSVLDAIAYTLAALGLAFVIAAVQGQYQRYRRWRYGAREREAIDVRIAEAEEHANR